MPRTDVLCIGAGPAGLTAAYLLSKHGTPVTVLEQDPTYVGGISRTVEHEGFLFDIGGHRFFSKAQPVEDLWTELLGDDLLVRPRSSKIFYGGQFYSYPLKPFEAFFNLGPVEAARCVLSYVRARLRPVAEPRNFEEWVVNQFGRRLYGIFFKTYTEKVWGMECRSISADWAAQRIKGLSLWKAVYRALVPQNQEGGGVIKTLITTFRYPRRGPGMMWEAAARKTREQGGEVHLEQRVTALAYDADAGTWAVTAEDEEGAETVWHARHVISSMPIRALVAALSPAPPAQVAEAAAALNYRDFLTVALMLEDRHVFEDNWIYIHEPGVQVGRIQNFKSWSPEMVPDPAMACYGLEYFCFEGDGLWTSSDDELIALGTRELERLGLAEPGAVVGGCVARQPKAYPVYDQGYAERVETIRGGLAEAYPNLHLVGRNGMHKYNNQDHAMMTAMLTVENIVAGQTLYDVWAVNEDAQYHEAGTAGSESGASGLRLVPQPAQQ